ncbi:hypothetical protein WR25_08803 [Diploscapter pachys]|uniref:J domain-containing protein n=1 Tax=Diploscapter pachys TaxID=2018661 RepID=A0A2A2L1W3_9BILA|nr:hypothetical protein WR25_08803 [Diploscapter pachys]
MNRDQAQECMDRARAAIKQLDADTARKMLLKAKRLDATQDIDYLMSKVGTLAAGHQTHSNQSSSEDRSYAHDDYYEQPQYRGRRPKSPAQESSAPKSPKSNGNVSHSSPAARQRSSSRTPKLGQLDLVTRIRHCKDYYEILRVTKSAADGDIKREYRKMALQLHPDKCRAPHATEAFKALGNAYAVLSDAEKRRQYDLYGAEAANGNAPTRRRGGDFFDHDYAHGFEADLTPEEIFNMFFGGGFPSDSMNRRRHTRHHYEHHAQHESPLGPLLQLLPIIAILVLGLLAQLMVSDPPFSLHHSNKYPIKRITAELKVPYFVRPDFEQAYKGRIKMIENQVEDEYIQTLRMNCYKEQNIRESKMHRARWMRDEQMLRDAEKMAMPNCNKLNEIYSR